MRIFKQDNKELKDFEEIILDIEKERDTISWCHATIQNCLWNLENPINYFILFGTTMGPQTLKSYNSIQRYILKK